MPDCQAKPPTLSILSGLLRSWWHFEKQSRFVQKQRFYYDRICACMSLLCFTGTVVPPSSLSMLVVNILCGNLALSCCLRSLFDSSVCADFVTTLLIHIAWVDMFIIGLHKHIYKTLQHVKDTTITFVHVFPTANRTTFIQSWRAELWVCINISAKRRLAS